MKIVNIMNSGGFGFNLLRGVSALTKNMIGIAVATIAILFVVIKLILPSYQKYILLTKENSTKNQLLKEVESKLNELNTTDYSELSAITDTLLLAIPVRNNYLALYGGVKALADKHNITIVDFQINPGAINEVKKETAKDGKSATIGIKLEVKGELQAIRDMVFEIENGLPITNVSELSFTNSRIASMSAKTQVMEAQINLVSYWQKLPDYLAKYESPLDKLSKEDYALYEKLKAFQPLAINGMDQESIGQQTTVGRDNPFPI